MKIKLYEVLLENADYIVNNYPQHGHNGPYGDYETILRVYSHWSILLIKAFSLTGKIKYRDRAIEFINYFFKKESRPYGFTFYHRKRHKKDGCNGLIGQAWTIEALMFAHEVLDDIKYKNMAEDVFLLHDFNKASGLWRKREIDGKNLWFDMTFNHQLWFAMAGSLIPNNVIKKQVKRFMERLSNNLKIHHNGLIKHFVFANVTTHLYFLKNKLSNSKIDKEYLYEKEIGYHSFSCYALSVLNQIYPNHYFWNSIKFQKILKYTLSNEHYLISEKSKYGFPYNPSGIETAYFVFSFRDIIENHEEIIKERLHSQFKIHLDNRTMRLSNNTMDENTLSARIYELVRMPNIEIDL